MYPSDSSIPIHRSNAFKSILLLLFALHVSQSLASLNACKQYISSEEVSHAYQGEALQLRLH